MSCPTAADGSRTSPQGAPLPLPAALPAAAPAGAEREIVADAPAMRGALELIGRAARSRANVLISGETGTGKALAARLLHERSPRAAGPFLALACTALPDELLEAELFGRVPREGDAGEPGLLVRASGGTLFLDAVGELSPALQARLVRALADGEARPVGGAKAVPVDVRLVSATQRDLEVEMQTGRFREDLYYRLDVIPLHLPPLRERVEDIPRLVELFARRGDPQRARRFTGEALRQLQRWRWPGNVRELENLVERILVLSDAPFVGAEELRLGVAPPPLEGGLAEAARSGVTMRELQDRYIEQMIAFTGGRKVEAAQRLGIDRKTLYRRRLRRVR